MKGASLVLKQKFELMASNKASYYTKGSPIQFIKMDLLREALTGDVAVCFSFKNVSSEPIQNLQIRFKCKDLDGEVVCDSTFCYEEIVAQSNEIFGENEAVYLSQEPLSAVDVRLLSAQNIEGKAISLDEYPRVRLPNQEELPIEIQETLQKNTNNTKLKYQPCFLTEGWQCSCGAFHVGAEKDNVYCDECGADRILVQNMITTLMRKMQGMATDPEIDQDPTRMVLGKAVTYDTPNLDKQATQIVPDMKSVETEYANINNAVYHRPDELEDVDSDLEDPDEIEDEELQEREERAKAIIRWVPVLTALLCTLVIAGGVMWYQFIG